MLANVFKTAAELNITDKEVAALKKVLFGLESRLLVHATPKSINVPTGFNMSWAARVAQSPASARSLTLSFLSSNHQQ